MKITIVKWTNGLSISFLPNFNSKKVIEQKSISKFAASRAVAYGMILQEVILLTRKKNEE